MRAILKRIERPSGYVCVALFYLVPLALCHHPNEFMYGTFFGIASLTMWRSV